MREFWDEHPDAEGPLRAWAKLVATASYRSPAELKQVFASASFIGGNVTVFNTGGNKYRVVVSMRYDLQRIYIRHVLTHAEYDRLSAAGEL